MVAGLEDYLAYLRFPSVSADPARASDMRDCAAWLAAWLADAGLASELAETGGPPVVIASTPRRHPRRVLLYGHYDVQPEDPAEGWTSPPFEPRVEGGVVTARGATDNKGQTMALLLGLRELMAEGGPPVDVVVVVEGEEEIGSPRLATLLRARADQLAADVALVADTSMVDPGVPSITLGLRGISVLEVEVRGPSADLHSGQYGGAVANPATVLARLIAGLHDDAGRVAVPGFHDRVLPPSAAERESWAGLAYGDADLLAATGAPALVGEQGWSAIERVWARPTAEVNGLTAGHQGAGSKTIVPATATAKLSFRLVADQDPDDIAVLVTRHLHQSRPAGVELHVRYDHGGLPYLLDPSSPAVAATRRAVLRVTGRPPALVREGLSVPIVAQIREVLGIDTILIGLGMPDCRAHSPDETFPVAHLALGAGICRELLAELAAAPPG